MRGWLTGTAGVAALAVATLTACGTATNAGAVTAGAPATHGSTKALLTQATAVSAAASSWHATTVRKLGSRVVSVIAGTGSKAEADTVYLASAKNNGGSGPFRLSRIDLASKVVTAGPELPVDTVSFAAGYLWVSGDLSRGTTSFRPVLYQVSPRRLTVLRSWRLAPWSGTYASVSVATGPDHTAWVGFLHTLWQLKPGTGATVRRVAMPVGLTASDVAVDPAGRYLYVSGEHHIGGATALEYAAGSGRLLRSAAHTPMRYAVAGAGLTAVPGGVWGSFRTGMLGQTILLRQRGLRVVKLPSKDVGLYGWGMSASTGYGAGSLWLSSGVVGTVACIAPTTGQVRSRAKLKLMANGAEILSVSRAQHEVLALGQSSVVALTAPASCWR